MVFLLLNIYKSQLKELKTIKIIFYIKSFITILFKKNFQFVLQVVEENCPTGKAENDCEGLEGDFYRVLNIIIICIAGVYVLFTLKDITKIKLGVAALIACSKAKTVFD